MKPGAVFRAVSLSAAVLVAAVAAAAPPSPPPASTWKSALTAPTSATAATIHISKGSKAQVKAGSGIVTFSMKLKGVLDNADMPVNLTGNTAEFVFLVNGMLRTKDFGFDIVDGKAALKTPVALTDAATWGTMLAAGATIEMRQVHVIQMGTGEVFGVDGLTTK